MADANGHEVALKAAEVAAAQLDPNIVPTPDTALSPAGPAWIQIGTEGGFLPAPVVIPNQVTTWIIDPTRFDVGNVDQHSLLLAPAERADVIVDFSPFAGKTLILYNDAPAAFPARVATYDYYTGDPDLTDGGGAPSTSARLWPEHPHHYAGCGHRYADELRPPNYVNPARLAASRRRGRTISMRTVKPAGVFESSHGPDHRWPGAYNSAYGTNSAPCAPGDGVARITDLSMTFNTLLTGNERDEHLDHSVRAQGASRRDELGHLRRIRKNDRQPRL